MSDETNPEKVPLRGDRLMQLRQAAHLNQTQFGARLGVTQNQISRYERGVMNPSLATLVNMARLLKTSTDYLLGLSDEPRPLTDDERSMLTTLRRRQITTDDHLRDVLRRGDAPPPLSRK